jgi:hypothetical protein
LAAGIGLVFWLVLGTAVVRWYDRRGFERLSPELLTHIGESVAQYRAKQAAPLATSDGAPPAKSEDEPAHQAATPPTEPTSQEISEGTT